MKKIIAILVMLVISCMTLAVGGFITDKNSSASADTVPTGVDVYFIAGQSNAAGCSDYYRYDCTTLNLSGEWLAKAKTGMYTNGFSNVLYFGCAYANNKKDTGNEILSLKPVKAPNPGNAGDGQATDKNREIGAEVGMAEYLNSHYGVGSENPNRVAVIVKYAVGASSILGNTTSNGYNTISSGANWCSWLSPSYAKSTGYTVYGEDLYHNMVGSSANYSTSVVYKAFDAIKNAGYTDIDLKGFYWSQGEAECNETDAGKHGPALEALINDFRTDLNAVSSNYMSANSSVNIAGATDLDFLISEIAPTFGRAHKRPNGVSSSPSIRTVVNAQKAVAEKLSNVYTLPTRNYNIILQNAECGYTVEDGNSYCQDEWHYNGSDMLEIGNEVGRTLYAINSVKSSSLTINVNAYNDDGQQTEIDEISLVAGDTYTAKVTKGVATFNSLPVATFEVKVKGFNHIDGDRNFVKSHKVSTKPNTTVTDTITVWESPIVLDTDAMNDWTIKTDATQGTSITTSYNKKNNANNVAVFSSRTFLELDADAKGVAFKYNYKQYKTFENDGTTVKNGSAYYPYVYAVDNDGDVAGIQFCHWANGFYLKATSIGYSLVNLGTVTTSADVGTAKINVYFEGTTLHYSISDIIIGYNESADVEGSYDLSQINANFTGANNIAFAFESSAGATGLFSGAGTGTADRWNIFDIEPILKKTSTDLAHVKLNIKGKNIRGVNGVSDANLNGKIAVLSSAGELNNYAGVIANGIATFNNVPYGKYELKIDSGNYIGIEKIVIDAPVVEKSVRANYQLFDNALANAYPTMHGDMDWNNHAGFMRFNQSLYGKITYAEAVFKPEFVTVKEGFWLGFVAKDNMDRNINFGLRFVPLSHGENISKTGDEWQIRVSNAYWNKMLINGLEEDYQPVVKIKVWIKDGALTLVACDATTDEEISNRIVRNDGYTEISGMNKQSFADTMTVSGLKLGLVSDIDTTTGKADASLWVEDIWPEVEVEPDPELPDDGGNTGSGDNTDDNTGSDDNTGDNGGNTGNENTGNTGNNNNNNNQQQGMACAMSTGEEYVLVAVFALFGACILTARKLKTKKD